MTNLAVTLADEQLVWQLISGSLAAKTPTGDGGVTHRAMRETVRTGRGFTVILALATLAADLLDQIHDDPAAVVGRHLADLALEAEPPPAAGTG